MRAQERGAKPGGNSQRAVLILWASLWAGCVDLTVPPLSVRRPDGYTRDGRPADAVAADGEALDTGTDGVSPETGADRESPESGADHLALDTGTPVDAPIVVPDSGAADAPVDTAPPAPPTIALTIMGSMIYAPSTGGTAFSSTCGPNQVLIGVGGTSGGMVPGLNSVQGTCGDIVVTGTGSYLVSTRSSGTLGPFGANSPVSYQASCPANQIVVGFSGGSGSWIDHLFIRCAALAINGGPGSYRVTVGTPAQVATRIGPMSGNTFAPLQCAAGQLAAGLTGAAGQAVDRLGLFCGTPRAQ